MAHLRKWHPSPSLLFLEPGRTGVKQALGCRERGPRLGHEPRLFEVVVSSCSLALEQSLCCLAPGHLLQGCSGHRAVLHSERGGAGAHGQ